MNAMIRITQHAAHTRAILYRPRHVFLPVTYISRAVPSRQHAEPRERAPCPPPPPPTPPPPRDYRLLWGAMAALALAGSFAVYAKTSPEIRDWLTINASWFDDVIAIAYQENMTYKEFALQCVDQATKYINKHIKDDAPKQCSYEGGPVKTDLELPDQPRDPDYEGDEESPCDTLPPPVVTRDVCELERCLAALGDDALNNYNTAVDACKYYNKLVEDEMQDFSTRSLQELRAAMLERQDLVNTSIQNANSAVSRLDDLSRYFECGVQAPPESLDNTRAQFNNYRDRISSAATRYQWENDRALAMDRQLRMVGELVDKYSSETRAMFPAAPRGDTDLLLVHANKYMQKLSCELQEARVAMTDRVNRGIETLSQGVKERSARETLIQEAVRRRRTEMDRDFRKRSEELRVRNEKMISDALKRQREKHEELLQQRLNQKEQEATSKLKKLVSEKVAAEKKLFSSQLADMRTKLSDVENKLNCRLRAEREVRRSQALWAAGEALLAATSAPQTVSTATLIDNVQKAAGKEDEFVNTILKSIPEYVRAEGVLTETVLRKKYYEMEKVALKVCLVEEDGAPLFVYFLSWIQYMLLFLKVSGIPQCEYEHPPKEPSEDLDTFDLLQRARFWLERGECDRAVCMVRAVGGAARGAAAGWLRSAAATLAVKHAAHAVRAHAAHIGLTYL